MFRFWSFVWMTHTHMCSSRHTRGYLFSIKDFLDKIYPSDANDLIIFFQVSITAMEESRVLIWHRDKLKLSIITDQFLQAVFDHILGRDVVKKLMQVRSGIFTLEGKFQKVFNRKNEKVEESPVRIFFLSVLKKKKKNSLFKFEPFQRKNYSL